MTIYETIAINQSNRINQCNVICRDISKAYDKIWPEGLKFKILQIGLPILFEKTLSNYLDNRRVKIKENNSPSRYRERLRTDAGPAFEEGIDQSC